MKTTLSRKVFFACVSLALCAGTFISCDKDEDTTTADTTTLVAVIDSCQTLLDAATTTYYAQASITTFQAVVTVANTALLNTSISQTAVNNLVVQLRAARETFLASAYGAISSSALIMALSFDEGTGTQLTTTGTYSWTAVLTAGPSQIFGTATNLPSFVTGKVGDAMYFSNGSHLEISDYTSNALLGNTLSISVWVKPDSTRAGNYIMSYNYWNTWKFQLQEQNKPFFTVNTSAGITNADNQMDFSAPNGSWTHLVVSMDLTNSLLTFYVNGESTMVWTIDTKPLISGTLSSYATTLPLMIGACTTYAEAAAWSWDWTKTPENWDSFIGAMDELKVYNIALTDGQVAKLYNDESE
jgi:hypothetical protein